MRRGLSKHGDAPPGRLAFMFNWDAFVLLRPVVADRDVQGACLEFARAHAPRLAADPDVREAFSLHLINLAEHCLLSGGAVKQCLAAVAAAEGGGGAGGDAGALKWLPAAAAGGGPALTNGGDDVGAIGAAADPSGVGAGRPASANGGAGHAAAPDAAALAHATSSGSNQAGLPLRLPLSMKKRQGVPQPSSTQARLSSSNRLQR